MEMLWIILITIISTYVFVAVTLFIFPTLLHKKHISILLPIATSAHRGGAGEFIENTMAAFNNAAKLGIHMLEIDVQQTFDGVLVIAHDNDLLRATGIIGRISDTLLSELPNYKNDLSVDFDNVKCSSCQNDFSFVKLDELFEKHGNLVIHIDTKEGNPSLIQNVAELVLKHNRYDKTVWGNMNESKNYQCFTTDPKIPMFFSISKVILVYLMFYLGLIGFFPIKESFFSIPFVKIGLNKFSDHLSSTQKISLTILDFMSMNRLLFWHLQKRGIKVVLFVLNSEKAFASAIKYNIDGIMTDFPSLLVKFNNKHEKARSTLSSQEDNTEAVEMLPNQL